jgi:uncharacterized membrane protein YgdD (TMEM256/DUF423 family)
MAQLFLTIAAIFGGTSVAAGAFGAHALREKISQRSLEVFHTGACFVGGLALILGWGTLAIASAHLKF